MILFPTHKELGGGFLFRGHQEEERTYMRYPELSAILLLTHNIEDNEVIIVKGCKRLNEVSGSGPTLKWVGRSIKADLREVPKNFTVVIFVPADMFSICFDVCIAMHDRVLRNFKPCCWG